MFIRDLPMVALLNLASWHRKQRDNATRVRKRTKNNQLRLTLDGEIKRFESIYNTLADEIERRTGHVNPSVSVSSGMFGQNRRNEAKPFLKSHQPERRIKAA